MRLEKNFSTALCAIFLLVALLGIGVDLSWAFSVDVKKLYYKDYANPTTMNRMVDYDFSEGTLTDGMIGIPDGSVVKSSDDTGISYVLAPAPEEGNDTILSLDTATSKATLTTGSEGVCIINAIPKPPAAQTIPLQWEYAVRFAGFTGIADTAKEYQTEIGLGSMTPTVAQPELSVLWAAGNTGWELVVQAAVRDESTDQTIWSQAGSPITGVDPATATIDLRIISAQSGSMPDTFNITFAFSLDFGTSWTTIGVYTISSPQPPVPGFPALFPYIWMNMQNTDSASSLSFTGAVALAGPDYPATSVDGVLVELTSDSAINTLTGDDGTFVLNGIPSGQAVSLKLSKSGYTPVYTATFNSTQDMTALHPYAFSPESQLAAWNVTTGKGAIVGRILDQNGAGLSGAVVSVSSQQSQDYTICYDEACTVSLTSTQTGGRYFVMNVEDNDGVMITAQKTGLSFNPLFFKTHSNGISQGIMRGEINAEKAALESAFAAAMTAYNAQNLADFMSFVSENFLDEGEDKADFQSEIAADMAEVPFQPQTYEILSTVISADKGTMRLIWDNIETETLFFIKEGTEWKLYGNQLYYGAFAHSGWQADTSATDQYWVNIVLEDPDNSIIQVHASGPGLPGEGVYLNHDENQGHWVSFATGPGQQDKNPKFGQTAPLLPLVYTLTIDDAGSTGMLQSVQTLTVQGFQTSVWAQNIFPANGARIASDALIFSWDAIPQGYQMGVELEAHDGTRIWERYRFTGTTAAYDGPVLADGDYRYHLTVRDSDGNYSLVTTEFTIGETITPEIVNFNRFQVTSSGAFDDDHPDWSPDGATLVFESSRSGNYNIWTVHPDGTGLINLTGLTGGLHALYPSWSPDGSKIAYIVKDTADGGWARYSLYTMNANGASQTLRPLPPGTSQDPGDTFWESEIKFTAWKDANHILFVSYGPDGGSFKIYQYDLANNTVVNVTPSNEANPLGDIYRIFQHRNSGRLVYDRWPIGVQTFTPGVGNYSVVELPGSDQGETPAMPALNPDGTKVAIVKDLYEDDSNIAVYDIQNSGLQINQTPQKDRWPVWSPDGKYLAIVSGPEFPDKRGSIWLLTVEPALPGDINGDGNVDMADALLAAKALAGITPDGVRSDYLISGADVNGDGKIGLHEMIYILKNI